MASLRKSLPVLVTETKILPCLLLLSFFQCYCCKPTFRFIAIVNTFSTWFSDIQLFLNVLDVSFVWAFVIICSFHLSWYLYEPLLYIPWLLGFFSNAWIPILLKACQCLSSLFCRPVTEFYFRNLSSTNNVLYTSTNSVKFIVPLTACTTVSVI